MLKRNILAALLLLASNQAVAFDHQYVAESVTYRLRQGDVHGLAADAFSNIFRYAAAELRERGFNHDADRMLDQWEGSYEYYVAGLLGDVGDHDPFSDWLALTYAILTADLGDKFLESSHIKDVWVLNFTLKIVFDPHQESKWCLDQLVSYPGDTCEAEYRRHFAGTKYAGPDPYATDDYLHHGFSGVVGYWLVWGACEGATYGTGWILICTPAGTLAEVLIEKLVAPKASDKFWERNNQSPYAQNQFDERIPIVVEADD